MSYSHKKLLQVKGYFSFNVVDFRKVEIAETTFHLIIPPLDKEIKWLLGDDCLCIAQESVDYLNSMYKGIHMEMINENQYFDEHDNPVALPEIKKIDESFYVRTVNGWSYNFDIVFLDELKQSFETMVGVFEDFYNIFNDKKFTDVTIRCQGGGELRAHKLILSARSVVFEKMISNETLELKTGIIHCNFDVEVMKVLLEHIYSNRVNRSKAKELYEAADYYELPYLMESCVNVLEEDLVPSNAISTYVFTEKFNEEKLKAVVLKRIKYNLHSVIAGEEWLKMADNVSQEHFQFLTHFVENN